MMTPRSKEWIVTTLVVILTLVQGVSGLNENDLALIIGCSVGGILFIFVIVIICCLCCRKDYDDDEDSKDYYNVPEVKYPHLGVWTTANPNMYTSQTKQKIPAPMPPGHFQHHVPQQQQHYQQQQQHHPRLPPKPNLMRQPQYPAQNGVHHHHSNDMKRPLIQRTIRGVRTVLKRFPGAVFQVRRSTAKPRPANPTRVHSMLPPKPQQGDQQKSVDLNQETIKTIKQNNSSRDSLANTKESGTACVYVDNSQAGSRNASDYDIKDNDPYSAKAFSNYQEDYQDPYDVVGPADGTVAKVYNNGENWTAMDDHTPSHISQSTGNLADNSGRKPVTRSVSTAAQHQVSASYWNAVVNVPQKSVQRTQSELKKFPSSGRNKYISNESMSDKNSSIPSSGMPGRSHGVVMNRRLSDVPTQPLTGHVPSPVSIKRPAPPIPHPRQVLADPPPRLPPSSTKGSVSNEPVVSSRPRNTLESETNVDMPITNIITVEAVIEQHPHSPRTDAAGVTDNDTQPSGFDTMSGDVTEAFQFLDEYGDPFDDNDIDMSNG